MALSRPRLNSVSAFDAVSSYTFYFNVTGGDQVKSNKLVITNQSTGVVVYQIVSQNTTSFSHILPANTLTNGTYYSAYVVTYATIDGTGAQSSPSNSIQFWAYSNPTFTWANMPAPVGGEIIINNSSFEFQALYNQAQGEKLNVYSFSLYNAVGEVISTSGTLPVGNSTPPNTLSYTFSGFEDLTYYYVGVVGKTVCDTDVSIQNTRFKVSYSAPVTEGSLSLYNSCDNGTIDATIDWEDIPTTIDSLRLKRRKYADSNWVTLKEFSAQQRPYNFTWAEKMIQNGSAFMCVDYVDGKFLAVGYDENGDYRVYFSSDGENWRRSNVVDVSDVNRFTSDGSKYYMVSSGANKIYSCYKSNCSNWSSQYKIVQNSSSVGWSSSARSGYAYGNNVHVMFNNIESNVFNYSTDGYNWTASSLTLPSGYKWTGVAFGNGRFVIVATEGGGSGDANRNHVTFYSTDGVNWSNGGTFLLRHLSFVGNFIYGDKFVFAGNYGVAYSTDGITWTIGATTDTSTTLAYGGGKYVRLGLSNRYAYYSTNLQTWSSTRINQTYLINLAYANGRFYCGGSFVGSGSSAVYYWSLTSTDGVSWSYNESTSGVDPQSLYSDGSRFICTQPYSRSTANSFYVSVDGINWGSYVAPETMTNTNNYSVFYGGGLYILNNTFGGLIDYYETTDFINWDIGANIRFNGSPVRNEYPSSNGFTTITTDTISNTPFPTDNPISWQEIIGNDNETLLVSVSYPVTSDSNKCKIAYLTTGDWTLVDTTYYLGTKAYLLYADSKFIILGNNGAVLYSTDGITWTVGNNELTAWGLTYTGIAYSGERYVVTALGTDIIGYTPNLSAIWMQSKMPSVDNFSWTGVTYGNSVFMASGLHFAIGYTDNLGYYVDRYAAHDQTYVYGLVPVTGGNEGGYVTKTILSQFGGVFIADNNSIHKLVGNVNYGNLVRNQKVGVFEPFSRKYPVIVSNGELNYDSGSFNGYILPSDFTTTGNLDDKTMVTQRKNLVDFLTNKKAKILKDWNGNIWMVFITGQPNVVFDTNSSMRIATIDANWTEIGDANDGEYLYANGLVEVAQ